MLVGPHATVARSPVRTRHAPEPVHSTPASLPTTSSRSPPLRWVTLAPSPRRPEHIDWSQMNEVFAPASTSHTVAWMQPSVTFEPDCRHDAVCVHCPLPPLATSSAHAADAEHVNEHGSPEHPRAHAGSEQVQLPASG